jgi:hypothetical protein
MASIVFYLNDDSPLITSLDEGDVLTIGRHPDSIVRLENASVSGHHATMNRHEDGWYVRDIGSSNGTRVNGAEIEEAKLADGDRVAFGDVQAVYYEAEAPATPPPTPAAKAPAAPRPELQPTAPPAVGVPHESARPIRNPRFRRRSPTPGTYPDQTGSGCATAAFLTFMFLLAFFIGLALRHYQETDRSLMGDIMERISRAMPKVKIEE